MFDCHACIHTCIRALFADVLTSARPTPQRISTPRFVPSRPCLRRSYATTAAAIQQPIQSQLPSKITGSDGRKWKGESEHHVMGNDDANRIGLEQELRYLKDPLKLANHTVDLLKKDQREKALEIVRLGSRDVACTVSWNHIIDYDMSKGKVAAALKSYNEMKKRAQPPDAYTYTILLRGLAWHTNYPLSLPRALSIYHSIHADGSPVRPSIIHTNAVLKVCSFAGDLDSMWGIAAKLPDHGKGAANNATFTTIFNAVRTDVWTKRLMDATPEEKAARRQRSVLQARRMWEDIIQRWRRGEMMMDSVLVSAMGSMLLLGTTSQDHDDVLSLVEQTMAIPRQVPRLSDPARRIESPLPQNLPFTRDLPTSLSDDFAPDDFSAPSKFSFTQEENAKDSPSSEPFEDQAQPEITPIDISKYSYRNRKTGSIEAISYAHPHRSTLSLVLDACIRMKAIRAAQDYWGILTDPSGYNIIPDAENYHMYLRLIRVQRASKLAVELVEDMKRIEYGSKKMLAPKTFRIALSCCVRDKKNPNVMRYAGRLVRIMQETLEEPDAKALGMYLALTRAVMTDPVSKTASWRVLLTTLTDMELCVANWKSLFGAYGRGSGEKGKKFEEVMELAKGMIGGYDNVLAVGREDLSRAEKQGCMERKARLSMWVKRNAVGGKGPGKEEARKSGDGGGKGDDGAEDWEEGVADDGLGMWRD